jgi:hypothetical protein
MTAVSKVDNSVIDVTIRGTKPLLMHSTYAMTLPKSKKVKSSEHDVAEEARLCLYLDDEKHIAVPSFAILSAMRKAATQLKKGGAGKKTLKDFVFSGLRIDPAMITLTPQEYVVDVQMVRIGTARIPRARPLFKDWTISFQITMVDEQTWDGGTVRQVLEEAGKYLGILDFRPLYGTFEIESMKIGKKEVK